MALYYKFKSAKQFTEFPISQRYISVREFKNLIFESKIGRGRDFDLIVTNATTGEDYDDNEFTVILENTKLLLRRIPGLPMKAIVVDSPAAAVPVEPAPPIKQETKSQRLDDITDSEWNETFSSISSDTSSTLTTTSSSTTIDDKKETTSKFNTNTNTNTKIVPTTAPNLNTPPNWYICHRCKIAGHYIQHCPTNGDPNYDILRPTIQNKVKTMSSSDSNNDNDNCIPSEFYCKLCNKIMDNAVMTRCCFDSFCENCIKNFTILNSKCLCGLKNISNDHLLPNLALRNTINRITGSNRTPAMKRKPDDLPEKFNNQQNNPLKKLKTDN